MINSMASALHIALSHSRFYTSLYSSIAKVIPHIVHAQFLNMVINVYNEICIMYTVYLTCMGGPTNEDRQDHELFLQNMASYNLVWLHGTAWENVCCVIVQVSCSYSSYKSFMDNYNDLGK